jgi:hypothetical protein
MLSSSNPYNLRSILSIQKRRWTRALRIFSRRCEDSVNMDYKEIGYEGVDWIHLPQEWRVHETRTKAQDYWVFGFCSSSSILKYTQWLRLAVSNGPSRVGVSHPLTRGRKQIQFPKRVILCLVEYQTMDKVQKPSNPECYIPSSEPFRIWWH